MNADGNDLVLEIELLHTFYERGEEKMQQEKKQHFTDYDMEQRIRQAKSGRTYWMNFVKKYNIDNTKYVLILPETQHNYNESALKNLPDFLKKRGIKQAYILSYDPYVIAQNEKVSDQITIVVASEEEIQNLIQLYCLYEFAPNVLIGSLQEPSGRKGSALIGKKGLSAEEVFAGVVYSLVDER